MIYRLLFTLVLERIDAERAHALAVATLRAAAAIPGLRQLMKRLLVPRDPRLEVRALGHTFPSPLGVGAGLDKDATWYEPLGLIGFGSVEVGTVTAEPQAGNPQPRIVRLKKDRGLLNWMGFPNPGAAVFAERLDGRDPAQIVGVNVGKTAAVPFEHAVADYRATVRRVAPFADYLALNVSSPNTAGLRAMQATDALRELVEAVRDELRAIRPGLPLLVKIGPDLADEDLDGIADLAVELGLDGVIAINTTVDRSCLVHSRDDAAALGEGGISGVPLKPRALEVLRRLRARAGDDLVLVSVGGIETAEDAWQRIRAGATLVQAHTAFIYGGPLWPSRINRGLARLVADEGGTSIEQFVGADGPLGRDGDARHSSRAAAEPVPGVSNGAAKIVARDTRVAR